MFKSLAKKMLWRMGFDLQRIGSSGRDTILAARLIDDSKTNVVLDVGANEGQFAIEMLTIRPDQKIVSFEPLSSAHKKLGQNAAGHLNWIIAERAAIGVERGTVEINVAGNSVSSSILPMKTAHLEAAPESRYSASEQVRLDRLDALARPHIRAADRLYLKIDTQGFERQVLDGAAGLWNQIVAIQLELSMVELYEGQTLAFELIEYLKSKGFVLYGLCNGFQNPASHELLQVDGFLISENMPS